MWLISASAAMHGETVHPHLVSDVVKSPLVGGSYCTNHAGRRQPMDEKCGRHALELPFPCSWLPALHRQEDHQQQDSESAEGEQVETVHVDREQSVFL